MACVYLFPVYATGHLISMLEFAKSLLQQQRQCGASLSLSITVLLMGPHQPNAPLCSAYVQSLQAQSDLPIQFHPLPALQPPPSFDCVEEFISIYIRSYLPLIKAALSASPSPVSGLFLDMFASDVVDVARELNIPSYIYFPSTATFLSLMFHLSSPQTKDHNDDIDISEGDGEIRVPGLVPIPSKSMPAPLINTKSTSYKWLLYHARRYREAKGIIVNSNIHLEPRAVEALVQGTQLPPGKMLPEIYPLGPIIALGENKSQEHEWFKWLDRQPVKSVLFLCFGSMGAFEAPQTREIAAGLEHSGHRFFWVMRTPSKELLGSPSDADFDALLSEGFIERTKERGLVWPTVVPQAEILAHPAIGGFVTHCGWNSILESLWCGVPMIPWPLYAEQHLNAFQLVSEMCVAVRLDVDRKEKGFVSAAELERAVRCLMEEGSEEGRRARDRAEEMKRACREAAQRGGVSFDLLQSLVQELGKVPNTQPAVSPSSQLTELVGAS